MYSTSPTRSFKSVRRTLRSLFSPKEPENSSLTVNNVSKLASAPAPIPTTTVAEVESEEETMPADTRRSPSPLASIPVTTSTPTGATHPDTKSDTADEAPLFLSETNHPKQLDIFFGGEHVRRRDSSAPLFLPEANLPRSSDTFQAVVSPYDRRLQTATASFTLEVAVRDDRRTLPSFQPGGILYLAPPKPRLRRRTGLRDLKEWR
ncbi:hypothetical protein B0T17DRAFT_638593 [Bombardia bombarda]|uniref:Uncharacterized protein n=1 Tax=Bombardia bombarda TaxID=252184 RepID=A0AA39WZY8_9PEZI|nr:hypothetical protein B0T17DRAFT_638593 [Bombardia bombarda]